MNILVPVKQVIDPYVAITIDVVKSPIKAKNIKKSINPFDEIALEQALRIHEQHTIGNIHLVTIGDQSAQNVLRHGLALGAQHALHILSEHKLQPLSVAKILHKLVLEYQIDWVLMGKQSTDGDHCQVGQMLASLLDWPQVTFASVIELEGKELRVIREIDSGLEGVSCQLPAVVTVDLRLNEPRYASLPNIVKAKSKPLITRPLADLELNLNEDLCISELSEPSQRNAGTKVDSVHELVSLLKHKEQVL